jgi:uncharacterized protein YjbJ (UPF0337 family)
MTTTMIEKNWAELKSKIKLKWGKLTDEEVESAKVNFGLLSEKIQGAYGIAKEHADRQFDEFSKTIQSLMGLEPEAEAAGANPTAEYTVAKPKPHLFVTPQVLKTVNKATLPS